MAGRHSAKKSKKPVVIFLVVVIIAVIGAAAFFLNSEIVSNNLNSTDTTTAENTDTSTNKTENSFDDVTDDDNSNESQAENSESSTGVENPTDISVGHDSPKETVEVIVPKASEGVKEGSFFNASYVPSSAVDGVSGERCSLKDVFGSSFLGGVLTFNSDGTFTDTLTLSSVDSGAYAVEGDTITVTYTNDKNLYITVNEWNGDEPAAFVIHDFGGYDIYFGY